MSQTTTIEKYDVDEIVVVLNQTQKTDSYATVYKASTMVNRALIVLGWNKAIPPQMMYNYHSKNSFVLSESSLSEWLTKYINNNNHKWTKIENNK